MNNNNELLKKIQNDFEIELIGYKWNDKILIGKICNIINKILDKYKKE